ncbi:MAG: hypothetical protein ACYTEO_14135 [Planctomycetota bacterium]|jgi:hypothetical protein
MATYGDNPAEYPYMPQKRKKQKYSLVTRVVDFTNNLPITSGKWNQDGNKTTAWAAADVLQLVHVRAGQTVMHVQVEVLTRSTDQYDNFTVGYGSDADRWGQYNLYGVDTDTNAGFPGVKSDSSVAHYRQHRPDVPVDPLYFASADTIDVTILRAAIQGKIRLIVHLMEDDR